MKLSISKSIMALVLGVGVTAQAGLYSATYSGAPYSIPDGTLAGVSSQIVYNNPTYNSLADVTVTINVSGGYNGDLYAYLSHNGVLVTLLNRVGTGGGDSFGYSTSGFGTITLDDYGPGGDIHNVANPVSGSSYQPDGGALADFNTANPNGAWTLYFADMSAGGGTSTLEGWSLSFNELTVVPEPVNIALGIFGGVFVLVIVVRSRKVRERYQCCRAAVAHWIDAV